MKDFQIILLSFLCLTSYGQSTLEIGTTWSYSQYLIGGPITPTYIEIVGDTLINGVKWYHLDGQGGCAFNQNNPPLLREENLKWYTYNVSKQTESLLYDFELNFGESYSVDFFGENFKIEMLIDSTDVKEINGINRKIQYCSNPNSNIDGFFFGSEIIEGIGSTGYLFPQGNICSPHVGPIRCYENSNQFVDFDEDKECDETYFPTNTVELNVLESIVYPNPANENQLIKIESTEKIGKISLYDSAGQIVFYEEVNGSESHIKVQKDGFYLLVIESSSKRELKKLIIMN